MILSFHTLLTHIMKNKNEKARMKQVAPILVSLNTNEAHRPRSKKIKAVIAEDDNFTLGNLRDCPFDLCFQWEDKAIHVELKDFTGDYDLQSDYVASIVNTNGHLYQQILEGRELQDPIIIVVLGDDADVAQAITRIVLLRGLKGQDVVDKIAEYTSMVENFEANCIALNIQVWRLKVNPWKRMILNIQKILQGGDLTAFRPRPVIRERQAVGLSILCGKGVGPARSERILEKFHLSLSPKEPNTYLDDCPGIGPKLARVVQNALNVHPAHVIRPKAKKVKEI